MRRSALNIIVCLLILPSAVAVADEYRVDELVRDLRSGNVEKRWQAARLLGTLGTQARPAVVNLTIALRDRNRTVRYYAARALASIGPAAGDIAEANLLDAADNDPNRYVREEAAEALRMVEPTPVFLKVPWLYAKVEGNLSDWMKSFRVNRYRTIVELAAHLRHKDVAQRRAAAISLGQLGWRAAPAATVLSAALRDEDESVRLYAAQALERIGPGAYVVAKANLQHASIHDRSDKVREQAMRTLSALFPILHVRKTNDVERPSGIPAITYASLRKELLPEGDSLQMRLVSADLSERRAAAWELAKQRRTDTVTIEYLCSALADRDETVRLRAVMALARAGSAAGRKAEASLDWVRRSGHTQLVLQRAILAMYFIDPDFANNTEEILVGEKGKRRVAKYSRKELWLAELKGPRRKQFIRELERLETKRIRGGDALPELAKQLEQPNSFTRAFTADVIAMIGFGRQSAVVFPLVDLSESYPSLEVRQAAEEALLLNLDEDVVAQLREPKPPELPTPQKVVRKGRPLSDRNIRALVGLLREEPEHRAMALRVLRARLDRQELGPAMLPLAMDEDRELRHLGMKALWESTEWDAIAGPLAYALQHKLGTAHTVELIDRIQSQHAISTYLIPYVIRIDDERIRQAGLRAWSRVARAGDWRRILSRPWEFWRPEKRRETLAALDSLDAKDPLVRSFITGGLVMRDDVASVKFIRALARAMNDEESVVEQLTKLYRGERTAVVRKSIVWTLAREKPTPGSLAVEMFVAMLNAEPEWSIRDQIVATLRARGPKAEQSLPALLVQLQKEKSIDRQIMLTQAIKVIGVGHEKIQATVSELEMSLQFQRARGMLKGVMAEQAKLKEETRQRQKRSLLRLLAN